MQGLAYEYVAAEVRGRALLFTGPLTTDAGDIHGPAPLVMTPIAYTDMS